MNRGEMTLTISSGIPREIAADRAGGAGALVLAEERAS